MLTRWMSVDLWTGRSQFRTPAPGPLTRVFYKNWSDHAGLDEDLVVFQMILSLGGSIKPLALSDFFYHYYYYFWHDNKSLSLIQGRVLVPSCYKLHFVVSVALSDTSLTQVTSS